MIDEIKIESFFKDIKKIQILKKCTADELYVEKQTNKIVCAASSKMNSYVEDIIKKYGLEYTDERFKSHFIKFDRILYLSRCPNCKIEKRSNYRSDNYCSECGNKIIHTEIDNYENHKFYSIAFDNIEVKAVKEFALQLKNFNHMTSYDYGYGIESISEYWIRFVYQNEDTSGLASLYNFLQDYFNDDPNIFFDVHKIEEGDSEYSKYSLVQCANKCGKIYANPDGTFEKYCSLCGTKQKKVFFDSPIFRMKIIIPLELIRTNYIEKQK